MTGKPLAEVIAKKLHEDMQDLKPQYGLTTIIPWDLLAHEERGLHIAVAAQLLESMGLLGLHAQLAPDNSITVTTGDGKTVHPPAKQAKKHAKEAQPEPKSFGYTGNFCAGCGSEKMVRNGACEKCMNCGDSSGCS